MRGVLLILLAANIAFLGWNLYRVREPAPEPPPAESSSGMINRMLLARELPAEPEGPAPDAAPAADPGPPAATDPLEAAPQVPEDAEAPASPGGETPETTPAGAAPAPESGPLQTESPQAARFCYRVGPLGEDTSIGAWRDRFQQAGAVLAEEWEDVERPSRYWVYLPPRESVVAAREALDRLRAAEVTDFIRVMEGPLTNAISLGLYSQERSAEQRLSYLRDKGFEPELDIRYEKERRLWLVLDAPSPRFPWSLPEGAAATAVACP